MICSRQGAEENSLRSPALREIFVMYDILITNGRVIDGAGNPWTWADVAVQNNRIVAVGKLSGAAAKQTLNADGQFVTPGFVDFHTHSDLQPLADPLYE